MATTASPICVKLDNDYHSYEKTWGAIYEAQMGMYKAEKATAEAMNDIQKLREAQKSRARAQETSRELSEETDRILTLMLAHKCPPPEHTASVFNHQEKD